MFNTSFYLWQPHFLQNITWYTPLVWRLLRLLNTGVWNSVSKIIWTREMVPLRSQQHLSVECCLLYHLNTFLWIDASERSSLYLSMEWCHYDHLKTYVWNGASEIISTPACGMMSPGTSQHLPVEWCLQKHLNMCLWNGDSKITTTLTCGMVPHHLPVECHPPG